MKKHASSTDRLKNLSHGVWWLPRFKRSFGSLEDGIPYMSADELFTVNPSLTKKILVDPNDDHDQYFVEDGWTLMVCSGQTYGMLGSSILANQWHELFFFSHDLIRIAADQDSIRSGYLHTALSHPTMGRPALLREAYGTSIPHLEPTDVENFIIPRFDGAVEDEIAKVTEGAKIFLSEANELDQEIASDADRIIDSLLGRVAAQEIAAGDI